MCDERVPRRRHPGLRVGDIGALPHERPAHEPHQPVRAQSEHQRPREHVREPGPRDRQLRGQRLDLQRPAVPLPAGVQHVPRELDAAAPRADRRAPLHRRVPRPALPTHAEAPLLDRRHREHPPRARRVRRAAHLLRVDHRVRPEAAALRDAQVAPVAHHDGHTAHQRAALPRGARLLRAHLQLRVPRAQTQPRSCFDEVEGAQVTRPRAPHH